MPKNNYNLGMDVNAIQKRNYYASIENDKSMTIDFLAVLLND
ncbi:hypothetical protein [Sphingobacterium sp. 1.A.5]|nr:hypothetical protein [Sphingobacterium sp. 1.A.5]